MNRKREIRDGERRPRRGHADPDLERRAIELAWKRLDELLEKSEWFRQADEKERARLRRGMGRLIDATAGPFDLRSDVVPVEFPEFVAELVAGVFEAMVTVSLQQMDAYLDLLEDATKGLESEGKPSARRQLLATMVLMGINRFRVDEAGRLTVRPWWRDEDDEDDEEDD